jgi:hypothetical protein
MKYLFVAALSLTASTARAAQVLGTFTHAGTAAIPGNPTATFAGTVTRPTPNPAQAINTGGPASSQPPSSSMPPSMTMTPAPQVPEPTGARNPSTMTWGPKDGPYQAMPYNWYQQQGKQQLECGYGWKKDSSGMCQKESWYEYEGCYETIIINKKPHCPVAWVTKTEEEIVYVTMTERMDTTVLKTATSTEVKTSTDVKERVVTAIEAVPTVRIWTKTEIMNETETRLKTMTETSSFTRTNTYTATETTRATSTARVTETDVQFTTVQKQVVEPVTRVTIWVSTQTNDRTEVSLITKSSTTVEQVTRTEFDSVTTTETARVATTVTTVVPTTLVSVWVTTETENGVETRLRTVSSTITQSVTATSVVNETQTATITQQRQVKETALMDCLNTCQNQWKPLMPAPPQPTYEKEVKPSGVYAPAPTPYTPPVMKDNMPNYGAPVPSKACGSYGC